MVRSCRPTLTKFAKAAKTSTTDARDCFSLLLTRSRHIAGPNQQHGGFQPRMPMHPPHPHRPPFNQQPPFQDPNQVCVRECSVGRTTVAMKVLRDVNPEKNHTNLRWSEWLCSSIAIFCCRRYHTWCLLNSAFLSQTTPPYISSLLPKWKPLKIGLLVRLLPQLQVRLSPVCVLWRAFSLHLFFSVLTQHTPVKLLFSSISRPPAFLSNEYFYAVLEVWSGCARGQTKCSLCCDCIYVKSYEVRWFVRWTFRSINCYMALWSMNCHIALFDVVVCDRQWSQILIFWFQIAF